ncbi:uncharacterized protein LOC135143944 isoform X1 [Zophobas morio]|uniref:uncharacterized protein LOC135143943 isoform X1 n=1 Tax=Zophobas morio TaxID=2755281 RepID=UPI0030832F77
MIRGKLHRTVAVIIPHYIKKYLTFINDYRSQAGVSDDNPYIFGLPGKMVGQRYRTLETCRIIRKYTAMAKLQNPCSIRTTLLRKQFATKTSTMNLQDHQKETVVNFMGHQRNIHDEYYRQQIVVGDLMIKKILDQESQMTMDEICERNEDKTIDPDIERPLVTNCSVRTCTEVGNLTPPPSTSQEPVFTTPKSKIKVVRKFNYSPSSEPYSGGSSDEWDPGNVSHIQKTLGPMTTKRRVWLTPKKSTAKVLFKNCIEKLTVPSLAECSEAIAHSKTLQTRTAQQVRQWVQHYIKTNYLKCDTAKIRRPWSTPEKQLVRKAFGTYIAEKLYPSGFEISELIKKHPILRRRSTASIKSFLQHERSKM